MQHTTGPTRYPVLWRNGDGAVNAGRLEIRGRSLILVGTSAGARLGCEVALAEIRDVRIGRLPHERLKGLPSLIVERKSGTPLAIADAGGGFGALQELADLLSHGAAAA